MKKKLRIRLNTRIRGTRKQTPAFYPPSPQLNVFFLNFASVGSYFAAPWTPLTQPVQVQGKLERAWYNLGQFNHGELNTWRKLPTQPCSRVMFATCQQLSFNYNVQSYRKYISTNFSFTILFTFYSTFVPLP